MPSISTHLMGTETDTFVKSIDKAIDNNISSDKEKKALKNELAKAFLQQLESSTLLSQAAETNQANIDNSTTTKQSDLKQSKSWVARHMYPILILSSIGLTFWAYWYIIFSGNSDSVIASTLKDVVIYILGALTTASTRLVGYLSSANNNEDNTKTILRLAKKEN